MLLLSEEKKKILGESQWSTGMKFSRSIDKSVCFTSRLTARVCSSNRSLEAVFSSNHLSSLSKCLL